VKGRAPLTIEGQLETGGPTIGRVFELDLAELRAGAYTLVLTVATPDGVERTSRTEIELLR
jgi:hypothetical protein